MHATLDRYVSFIDESSIESYQEPMSILVKFPTRSRPDQFLQTFSTYITKADDPKHIRFLITLDANDDTVTPEFLQTIHNIHPHVKYVVGTSKNKIDAVNRDMDQAGDYDILLLASDDMIPVVQGYDRIIRDAMKEHYPDRDGVLFFNDGYNGSKLNTLSIMGKPYYERFHYLYHPSYKSLYCDNEFMHVAQRLGKQTYFDQVIIRHDHPKTSVNVKHDALYQKNYSYTKADHDNYIQRKRLGFP